MAWGRGALQDTALPKLQVCLELLRAWTSCLPCIQPWDTVLVTLFPPPAFAHSVCRGRQWHCTGQRCGGWCQASGASHYVTFDGLVLTFPGACEYLLVREASGQFAVSAQNLPCGAGGLTCTKALTVRLWGTVVHMLRGGCDTEGPHGREGVGHTAQRHSSAQAEARGSPWPPVACICAVQLVSWVGVSVGKGSKKRRPREV